MTGIIRKDKKHMDNTSEIAYQEIRGSGAGVTYAESDEVYSEIREDPGDEVSDQAEKVSDEAEKISDQAGDEAGEVSDQAEKISDVAEKISDVAEKVSDEAGDEAGDEAKLLDFCSEPKSKAEIQQYMGIKSERYIRQKLIMPLLEKGLLYRTLPDKPSSPNQKYVAGKREIRNNEEGILKKDSGARIQKALFS